MQPGQSVVVLGTSLIPELLSNHPNFTNSRFCSGKQVQQNFVGAVATASVPQGRAGLYRNFRLAEGQPAVTNVE
ncbi:hypothetical protein CGZ80_06025 [Rhodopirellula sp. MGV]|nr:hypothetical protein CGZ80_06025 [Rhodopirellula sp. MGV]